MFTDQYSLDDSADYGVNLSGRLFNDHLGYSAALLNGDGYSSPNAAKAMDYNLRLTFLPFGTKGNLHISGQFRDGYRGTKA